MIFLFLLFQTTVLAQPPTSELSLNQPINTELATENSIRFTVQLLANQTARVEVDYQGFEVSVFVFDPSGEKFMTIESPSGAIGKRVLFLMAENAGEFTVEVARVRPIPTKFVIQVTEIRETNQNDRLINETRGKINQLVAATPGDPGANQTIGEQRKTIEIRREIIELSKIVDDKFHEARSLIFIGARYQSLGEMQPALDAWLEAREIYREMQRPDLEGLPVLTIGSIYLTISEFDKAIEYFAEAETLLNAGASPLLQAAIYGLYASAYYPKNQHQKAIESANKALEIYSSNKIKLGEMTIYGLLGTIYQDAKQPRLAIENIEKALVAAEGLEKAQGFADLQIRLGILYWENGRKEEANGLFLQGKEIAERVGQKHLTIQVLYQLAVVENDRGNLAGAIERLENGIEMIEKIRSGFQDKAQRASYFSTVQDFYELYTDLLIKRSAENKRPTDISLAFEISERSRARSLTDLLEEARIDFTKTVDSNLLDQQKDLSNQLDSALQSQKSLSDSEAPQDEIDRVNSLADKLTKESESLAARIERESPRYASLTRGAALSTKEIQQLLDNETVLLEFKLGRERSFLWLVSNQSIKYFELPKREELEKQVREFYELTVANRKSDSAKIQKLSKELNRTLLSQVSNEIRGKRIAIVAEGILQYLPFSALQDDESTFLADKNEIIVLPSASVLAELRLTRPVQNDQKIAIFADPVFDKEDSRLSKNAKTKTIEASGELTKRLRDFRFGEILPRLLASRQEARNITALADKSKVTVKTDFDANVYDIQNSDLNSYQILHFATHGLLNTSNPELSGLVFSLYDKAGNPQNGFLDLNDIYNLKISSDMVVLSACQTGLGKDVRGEGLIGISRGFLYAGSKRVVASLWKVDDSATAEFMKLFYKNHLQKGLPASSALRAAKLELKKIPRYRSPYYWTAFTILGDWR